MTCCEARNSMSTGSDSRVFTALMGSTNANHMTKGFLHNVPSFNVKLCFPACLKYLMSSWKLRKMNT